MSDLADFTRTRLAEDQQDVSEDHMLGCTMRGESNRDIYSVIDECSCLQRRALLTVAALRAVVAEHEVRIHVRVYSSPNRCVVTWWTCATCNPPVDDPDEAFDRQGEEGCPTLRAVASIWRDHPDFRPEWGGRSREDHT